MYPLQFVGYFQQITQALDRNLFELEEELFWIANYQFNFQKKKKAAQSKINLLKQAKSSSNIQQINSFYDPPFI